MTEQFEDLLSVEGRPHRHQLHLPSDRIQGRMVGDFVTIELLNYVIT